MAHCVSRRLGPVCADSPAMFEGEAASNEANMTLGSMCHLCPFETTKVLG